MKKTKNKVFFKLFFLSCLIIFSFSIVSSVFAQALVPCGLDGTANCTLCHLVIGFQNIYNYLLSILLVATTVVIVIAGVMYMVSSGNKEIIEKAKSAFLYALTAIILALTAWLIINTTLHALGYKNVGNWWTFTCDTTQSLPQTTGTSGATLPGSSNLTGTGCAGVVQNALSMVGYSYSQSNRMGASSADCSSVAYRAYSAAGCSLPNGSSEDYLSIGKNFSASQQTSLNAGDLLVYSGHVATCLNDGCTQVIGANSAKGIYTKDSGYDIKKATKVIKASDYCPNC